MDTIKNLLDIFGIKQNYLELFAKPRKTQGLGAAGFIQANVNEFNRTNLSPAARNLIEGAMRTGKKTVEDNTLPAKEKLLLSDFTLSFKSGPVAQATYNMSDKSLTVIKNSGDAFKYSGVPVSTMRAWERTASPAEFFINNVQKNFSAQKLLTKDKSDRILPDKLIEKFSTESKNPTIPAGTKAIGSLTGQPQTAKEAAITQSGGQSVASFTVGLPPSSTIQTAIYFPNRNYLRVTFKNGGSYSYDDVPKSIIRNWAKAPSAGSYFWYNIRMTFKYQKI